MKHFWENPFFSISVLLFFVAGFALATWVPHGHDILFFNELRTEPLNSFFRFCTLLGEAWAYVVLGVGAFFVRYRFAMLIALTGLLVMPISYVLKDQIGHDRPITWFEQRQMRDQLVLVPAVELASGRTSFPSGHTMAAFALFSVVTMLLPRRLAWLGLLTAYTAVLVAVSRIFLVQHFLVDVLAGAAVGLGVSLLALQISRMAWFQNLDFLDKSLLHRDLPKG
ncbi:MAG: phosphatase PAP2 family protein [Saprospiraceae bacterium]